MTSTNQQPLDREKVRAITEEYGVSLTLFQGWETFVEQCLFWAPPPKPEAAKSAVETIRERLIGVEASPTAVALWEQLARA